MANRDLKCNEPGCDIMVYAKGICRKHYNKQRWHLDYEIERRRSAKKTGRKVEDIPRRERMLYGREERLVLLGLLTTALSNPAGKVCQMKDCGRPAHHNGVCGLCQKHYERERMLRIQLDMPRPDRRYKPGAGRRAQSERSRRPGVTELQIRREAARRGVTPGVVAKEMGVHW